MRFGSNCGGQVVWQIPQGDHVPRHVCQQSGCARVHYQNPCIVVGTLPVYQNRLLLCRRAIEPRRDYWTLPGGFMENGETLQQGALRETYEETLAQVSIVQLLTLINLPHHNQVHIFYLAQLAQAQFGATTESLEVKLVALEEIPWHALAFRSVYSTLKHYQHCMALNRQTDWPVKELTLSAADAALDPSR